jgi:hypothetical protein
MKSGTGLGSLDSGSDPVKLQTFDSDPVVLPPGVPTLDSDPIVLPGAPKFDSDPPVLSGAFSSIMNQPARAAGAPPPLAASSGDTGKAVLLWIALAVVSFVVLIAISVSVGREAIEWSSAIQENPDVALQSETFPTGPYMAVAAANLAFYFILSCFPAYWGLRIVEALPFNDFGQDMKDIALYTLYCFLLFPIILVGWIIALVILKRHYDLSFGKLMGVAVLWCVFNALLSIPFSIAYQVIVGSVVS